jgi:prepilin signal peptidase PulO-like enzyme (type II secretory pathway)
MFLFIVLFAIGLCMGSFAYALAMRLYDGRDYVRGRSECEACKHTLAWYDLVPVVSWLSTGGKCRYCSKGIGRSYPLVEIATGLLFGLSYIHWPYDASRIGIAVFGLWLVMLTVLVTLTIFDAKWYMLPDKLVFTLIALAASSKLFQAAYYEDLTRLVGVLGGMLVGGGVFYAIWYLSKGKFIGYGDVKLGIFFGILLGSPFKALLVLSIGSMIGTLLVLPSIVKHKAKLTSAIPFGPSLIAATCIMYIFGDRIVHAITTFYIFP